MLFVQNLIRIECQCFFNLFHRVGPTPIISSDAVLKITDSAEHMSRFALNPGKYTHTHTLTWSKWWIENCSRVRDPADFGERTRVLLQDGRQSAYGRVRENNVQLVIENGTVAKQRKSPQYTSASPQ